MKPRQIYPDRDIATPEPVPGRAHMDIQTEQYIEQLTDKPPTDEQAIATEFYLDRPPVPLFQPKMPLKENCKYTQIFDGDHELFDFDAEVEPMLNVLCEKTLEQARMEVLEEEELRIIKEQQKEYEEIRNAELIEAQRYEAAEARVRGEAERRKVQQKARKAQRKAAHQKYVCRVLAKKHLIGLRENALRTCADYGLMEPELKTELEEDLLPWLIQKMQGFIGDAGIVNVASDVAMSEGISKLQHRHQQTLEKHRLQKEQDAAKRAHAAIAEQQRKQDRRKARAKREKDQAKEKMFNEIKQHIINKGDVKNPCANVELYDFHGCYEKVKPLLISFGGHVMQMYYVINAIFGVSEAEIAEHYIRAQADPESDLLKKAHSPRELLLERYFLPFLCSYLKEMKADFIPLLIPPQL